MVSDSIRLILIRLPPPYIHLVRQPALNGDMTAWFISYPWYMLHIGANNVAFSILIGYFREKEDHLCHFLV